MGLAPARRTVAQDGGRTARQPQRRGSAGLACALSFGPVFAVGGQSHLAGQGVDRVPREPLHPGLFTHNSGIALMAFALGFAFGAPTIFLILINGLMLGAFLALFFSHGLGFQAVGWLSIHGTTEILAVILAGAAGLRIGWTLAFP